MKRIIKTFFLAIAFLLLIATVGCLNIYETQTPIRAEDALECVTPENKLAFPVAQAGFDYSAQQIHPSPDWIFQSALPGYDYASSIAYENDNIWVVAHKLNTTEPNSTAILRYNIMTNEWKSYLSVGMSKVQHPTLVASKNGIVWGFSSTLMDEPSTLFRYDIIADKFNHVLDKEKLLSTKIKDITGFALDRDNNVWLTDPNGLYELASSSLELQIHVRASGSERFSKPVVSNNGDIWFLDYGNTRIMKYSPATEDIFHYSGHPHLDDDYSHEDFSQIITTYFDSEGKLWLDDRGWLDTNLKDIDGGPLWFHIIRSGVFVDHSYVPDSKYVWGRPNSILESSNGMLWFSSNAGLVNLNLKNDKWCLLPLSGPVIEDKEHYLWAFYSAGLYKHQLKP
jgi:hypothetical protein